MNRSSPHVTGHIKEESERLSTGAALVYSETALGYPYSDKSIEVAKVGARTVGGIFATTLLTGARDGTVTGYTGTKHLSLLCESTVDSAEITVTVYGPDGSAPALNRDKTAFGTSSGVSRTNTFMAARLGGFTTLGSADGAEILSLKTPEVAGVRKVGTTDEEKSREPENNIRFGRGLRLGTHIVNSTNRSRELSGTVSFGNGITFVAYVGCI